jgi:signal transduction histidine kinase
MVKIPDDYYQKRKSGEFYTGDTLNKAVIRNVEADLKREMESKQHLANVISGINHEISPWLGSIANIVNRLEANIARTYDDPSKLEAVRALCEAKLKDIGMACEQAAKILSMLSKNVKKVQTYAVDSYNLKDTVESWVSLILMDRHIKSAINENNIVVDLQSLDFNVTHSPMLVSQIILNLAKNTVDHNQHILDTLKIRLYGKDNCLIYEDNGKGITEDRIQSIFEPGLTTKTGEIGQHGFGLSACMDYCVSMGAMLWAESDAKTYTRFIVNFEFESHRSSLLQSQDSNTEKFNGIKKKKKFLLNEDLE